MPKKDKPALTQPALTQPALTQPALTQPALTQPALTQPALTAPLIGSLQARTHRDRHGRRTYRPDTRRLEKRESEKERERGRERPTRLAAECCSTSWTRRSNRKSRCFVCFIASIWHGVCCNRRDSTRSGMCSCAACGQDLLVGHIMLCNMYWFDACRIATTSFSAGLRFNLCLGVVEEPGGAVSQSRDPAK